MFVCIIFFFLSISGFVKEKHKHGALESSGVALESLSLQSNGALSSFSDFLESLGCDAGTFLPQKMQRWNPSVFRWNPDSRKIMGRWNHSVVFWNLGGATLERFSRKNAALESLRVSLIS